jgi:LacI family transcriptional regulator
MPRKPSTEANLASIAQRLGISISTVSRALRNADGIHSTTRTKVWEMANQLGYKIPKRKVGSTSGRSTTILALTHCAEAVSDQRYLVGMSRVASSLNLSIISHHLTSETCAKMLDARHQPPAMRDGQVDGIVLIHFWPHDIAAQLSRKCPTVSVIHYYPDTEIETVAIDDHTGIYSVASHLFRGGHRKIGFFGLCREMTWTLSRFAAYVESLLRLGLDYDPESVVPITWDQAFSTTVFPKTGWSDHVDRQLARGVDAWVCSGTIPAHTLCRYFLDRGLRIPEDVALTGYHRGWADPGHRPVLTSTQASDEELGEAALRRLIYRLKHPEESLRTILIPASFSPGETTRPELAPANAG